MQFTFIRWEYSHVSNHQQRRQFIAFTLPKNLDGIRRTKAYLCSITLFIKLREDLHLFTVLITFCSIYSFIPQTNTLRQYTALTSSLPTHREGCNQGETSYVTYCHNSFSQSSSPRPVVRESGSMGVVIF